jgi:hypothetical protein
VSGKGSRQRPTAPTFAENYDRIFGTTELYEDRREAMRQAHLTEAQSVILNAPLMSPEMREQLDKAWASFDAAYPQPHDLNPKEPK